jgi:hypothetical protein
MFETDGRYFSIDNPVVFLMDIQCLFCEVEIEILNDICIRFLLQRAQSIWLAEKREEEIDTQFNFEIRRFEDQ